MSILSNQLLQLQQKQELLLKHYLILKRENVQLKKSVSKKEAQLQKTEDQLKDLQQKLDAEKLSKGSLDNPEKKVLEKRLNEYIKEIDRCLKLLNT